MGARVVSLLNVLDRCDEPSQLLRDCAAQLHPAGKLLVSVVLPFRPSVEVGGVLRPPRESLGLPRDASFEESVSLLYEKLIRPEGWHVERFARVPYLSDGDTSSRLYTLEDAAFVLSRQ